MYYSDVEKKFCVLNVVSIKAQKNWSIDNSRVDANIERFLLKQYSLNLFTTKIIKSFFWGGGKPGNSGITLKGYAFTNVDTDQF